MAFYKVLAIKILLKNNTVAKRGDVVDEKLFTTDAETLTKGNYVSKVVRADLDSTEPKKEDKPKVQNEPKAKPESKKAVK